MLRQWKPAQLIKMRYDANEAGNKTVVKMINFGVRQTWV